MAKIAIITSFMGELRDRFCFYNQPHGIVEKLEAVARVPGVAGVEMVYPYDFQDPELTAETLQRLHLEVAAVNVNVKGEREFANGSLTSPDAAIRARAVEFIKGGMDAAAKLGCKRAHVCPLSDGHDYPFQADYIADWKRLRDCFVEAAKYRPDVTLSLEYKPNETRVRSTLAGALGAILLIKETGAHNLGITIDIGHSLYGGETPAQSLALMYHYGIKPYIHVNDNYRNWDWDLAPGSINPWDVMEFLWTAKQNGYDDWYTMDVFPARMDPEACFRASVKMLNGLLKAAGRIDARELAALRADTNLAVPRVLEYIWEKAGWLG